MPQIERAAKRLGLTNEPKVLLPFGVARVILNHA